MAYHNPMPATTTDRAAAIQAVVREYWGFDQLRPLQREAIEAALEQRDSLVVLPTGGGKSLCYAVPPIVAERTDVVVSPLIALMKDQVDALQACGYPAAALHSGLTESQREEIAAGIKDRRYRLLFVAPERLLTPWFLARAKWLDVRAFAIDEAHCISQWGHDFRPEYRRLTALKQAFPTAAIHAYTATATQRVREDIIEQLGLQSPQVLVGRFDRPNLVYRIVPRRDTDEQVYRAVLRHPDEAVIVYCISRKDTERLAGELQARGIRAAAYHAGLDATLRTRTQEQFAAEEIDVVVATVAFGMGIDRSNVRCVIHSALPKSVEQYQQETGRAGRDGLEAECLLLYASADAHRWEQLIRRPGPDVAPAPETVAAQLELLEDMQRFAGSRTCRHAALSRYFGQEYEQESCGACDICLREGEATADRTDLARTVLQCIVDMRASYGLSHLADILRGANSRAIQERGHATLRHYGALRSLPRETVLDVLQQLVHQELLFRTVGDRPVVVLTPGGRAVLAGEATVALAVAAAPEPPPPSSRGDGGWEGVDRGLFEHLRGIRRALAQERAVPAFVILSDATLRELARLRPTTRDAFARVRGIGEHKLADFGDRFLDAIAAHGAPRTDGPPVARPAGDGRQLANARFAEGRPVAAVAAEIGRAVSTVQRYLEDYLAANPDAAPDPWVTPDVYARVRAVALDIGAAYLRPVYEALNGDVSYEEIRTVLRHAGLK